MLNEQQDPLFTFCMIGAVNLHWFCFKSALEYGYFISAFFANTGKSNMALVCYHVRTKKLI